MRISHQERSFNSTILVYAFFIQIARSGHGVRTRNENTPHSRTYGPGTEEGSIISGIAIHDPFQAALALHSPTSRDGNCERRAQRGRLSPQPKKSLPQRLLYEVGYQPKILLSFVYFMNLMCISAEKLCTYSCCQPKIFSLLSTPKYLSADFLEKSYL